MNISGIIDIIKNHNFTEVKKFFETSNINFQNLPIVFGEKIIRSVFASTDNKKIQLVMSLFSNNISLVGISHTQGYWTKELQVALKNIASSINKNILIIPISSVDWEYLEHFSMLVNPGAGDSFPKILQEFNISYMNYVRVHPREIKYQKIINYAVTHDVPYLGICSGAQHLILNRAGFLMQKTGNDYVSINYGSDGYFLSMNSDELYAGFNSGIYPDTIQFPIYVAHKFAGVEEKLGEGIKLGGKSSEGAVELVTLNLYQVGYQFHPEYNLQEERNYNLLVNIMKMATISKTTNMKCMHQHLLFQFENSFKKAICSFDKTMSPSIDFPRDIIGEILEICALKSEL